jgi:hypothetical protein
MASGALTEWNGSRRRKLGQLWHIRNQAALPWQERHADEMLVVRLATEFQGYARDLHDEAIAFLAITATSGNQALASILQVGMASDRMLNRGNVGKDVLAKDFARIGMIFWPALEMQARQLVPQWKTDLRQITEMRNSIVHEDRVQLLRLRAGGLALNRPLVQRWQGSIDQLAATMDDVVGSYLGALLGVPQPW